MIVEMTKIIQQVMDPKILILTFFFLLIVYFLKKHRLSFFIVSMFQFSFFLICFSYIYLQLSDKTYLIIENTINKNIYLFFTGSLFFILIILFLIHKNDFFENIGRIKEASNRSKESKIINVLFIYANQFMLLYFTIMVPYYSIVLIVNNISDLTIIFLTLGFVMMSFVKFQETHLKLKNQVVNKKETKEQFKHMLLDLSVMLTDTTHTELESLNKIFAENLIDDDYLSSYLKRRDLINQNPKEYWIDLITINENYFKDEDIKNLFKEFSSISHVTINLHDMYTNLHQNKNKFKKIESRKTFGETIYFTILKIFKK